VIGWFIFVFIGSISNLFWLYLSNKKELHSIFDYGLQLLVFKKNSMLAIAKSLLRFYLNITIFFPFRLIQLGNPNIYLALVIGCMLLLFNSKNLTLIFVGLTSLQFWVMHVFFFLGYKKNFLRKSIKWVYDFQGEEEIDLFFFKLISNPYKKLFDSTLRYSGGALMVYALSLGEVIVADKLAMANVREIIGHTPEIKLDADEVLRLKHLEAEKLLNNMPIKSAINSCDSALKASHITINKVPSDLNVTVIEESKIKGESLKSLNDGGTGIKKSDKKL